MEHRPEGGVPVIKAGSDAHTAAVVDVTFGAHVTARGGAAMAVGVTFEDVAAHAPEPELEAEVGVISFTSSSSTCASSTSASSTPASSTSSSSSSISSSTTTTIT